MSFTELGKDAQVYLQYSHDIIQSTDVKLKTTKY